MSVRYTCNTPELKKVEPDEAASPVSCCWKWMFLWMESGGITASKDTDIFGHLPLRTDISLRQKQKLTQNSCPTVLEYFRMYFRKPSPEKPGDWRNVRHRADNTNMSSLCSAETWRSTVSELDEWEGQRSRACWEKKLKMLNKAVISPAALFLLWELDPNVMRGCFHCCPVTASLLAAKH